MSLHHVTLATRDVARSARFFQVTLGWRPIPRPDNVGQPAAWLEIAPGQELHLLQVADYQASSFEKEFGRHIAVAYPERSFDQLKQRLIQHGARIRDAERPTPYPRFFFEDLDGYVFEIVPDALADPAHALSE